MNGDLQGSRVLIAGVGNHREAGLVRLREAGHTVGVLGDPANLPASLLHVVYPWTPHACAQDPARRAELASAGWDVVVCWDELCVEAAQQVSAHLGIPGPAFTEGVFRDKGLMRTRLAESGCRSPRFVTAQSTASLEEIARLAYGLGYPVVVKPADYTGSSGVRLVREQRTLQDACTHAFAKSRGGGIVIEQYVCGPEVSVETVTYGSGDHLVVGVTAKKVGPEPFFVETEQRFPADLGADEQSEIIHEALQALGGLGMHRGVSHTELRLSTNGPVVMESAARVAGDYIPTLVSLAGGPDMYTLEVDAMRGHSSPPAWTTERAAAVRFFLPAGAGRITWPSIDQILGTVVERTLTELHRWHPTHLPTPSQATSSGHRLGCCILSGPPTDVDAALGQVDLLAPVAWDDA